VLREREEEESACSITTKEPLPADKGSMLQVPKRAEVFDETQIIIDEFVSCRESVEP
jgi:hypothetical protein